MFFIFFLWTFLFHSLQFSSKLPETWHIYVKIPCADSNHLQFWKFLLEKKVVTSKYLRKWKSPKKLSPKLGKLFEFCLQESNRALAEMNYHTYDTSLWHHINFYDVIPIFWHFLFFVSFVSQPTVFIETSWNLAYICKNTLRRQ